MVSTLLTLLPFLAGTFGLAGLYAIWSDLSLRDSSRINQRINDEFRNRQRERARTSPLFKKLGQRALEAPALELEETATLDSAAVGLWPRFEDMVKQSGLDVSPMRLLVIALGAGLLLGALGGMLRGLMVGILGLSVGFGAPLLYVHVQWTARMRKFLAQLPDAFDLMSRVVRAGHSVPQALQAVADEFEPPIAAEFSYCCEQQNLGLLPEVALRDLARRTGLLEIKIFVTAMLVQRQTGGNLTEMLERLAALVRDRLRIQGMIRSLTGEGRLQALVLLVLPPLMFGVLMVINRKYAQVLLDRPNLLIGMLISMGVGALWIRKIVNIDV